MRLAWLAGPVVLAACAATAPTQPGLMALPGTGKTLEQFNADDGECRQYAAKRAAPTDSAEWPELQRSYDYAYIQCMYVKGHRVPVSGQFVAPPAAGPPPPKPELDTAPTSK